MCGAVSIPNTHSSPLFRKSYKNKVGDQWVTLQRRNKELEESLILNGIQTSSLLEQRSHLSWFLSINMW